MSEVLKAVSGIAALLAGNKGKQGKGHVDATGQGRVAAAAQLDRRRVSMSEDYEGHLMVSVGGSDKGFERTPICTVLVLDVSTSMAGEKLGLLKETASKIAKNLTDKDEIAIVAFASHVETVLERTSASNKEAVLAAISRLRSTGCTNMSGGFSQGLRQVNERFKGVKRIMLLTDGQANEGVRDRDGLLGMVKCRDSSSTLSTFGFGTDCDQELLADMARAGGGNYYFISGKDIKNVFARELGGMLSCIGQNLEVRVRPNRGGEVLEVLNDFTVEDRDGEAVINAEDLFAGETKHVLLRVRLARPEGKPKARPFSVAHVTVSWDDVKAKRHERIELNPKVTFAKDADAEPVLEVAEQVALIEAANAQLRAVEAANRGDFGAAQGILRGATVMFSALADRGSESARGLVGTMDASVKGFAAGSYNAAYGSTVSNAAMNATKYRKAGGDGEAFLSANVAGTRSMDSLEADFTDGGGVNLDPPGTGGDDAVDPVNPLDLDPFPPDYDAAGGEAGWSGQWTDGDGNPVTYIPPIDIPDNDAECTGEWRNCPCGSCAARRTLGHIQNRPVPVVRPARPPIAKPGFPSPGRPDPAPERPKSEPKIDELKDKSKFAKRSRRWK